MNTLFKETSPLPICVHPKKRRADIPVRHFGKGGLESPPSVGPARHGFTLMEVNVALLIMAIGVTGILTLFPVGMRQADTATSETTETAFADLVLNGMRANAQMVTNWNDWTTLTTSGSSLLLGQSGRGSPILLGSTPAAMGDQEINDYLVSGQYIHYSLTLGDDPSIHPSPLIKTATIQVTNRRFTDVSTAPTYVTWFVYTGM